MLGPAAIGGSMDERISISRAANGFKVCVKDPAIVELNEKSDGKWMDPEREYLFDGPKSMDAALDFIKRIAPKALPKDTSPKDTFISAFDDALKAIGGDHASDDD